MRNYLDRFAQVIPTPFFGNSCSPIVEGDYVIVNVGAKGASIVAFDRNTGKDVWKKLDDKASYASPIADGALLR